MSIAKTKPAIRLQAITSLQAADWVHSLGVSIENLADAARNEDDFDACFTAAALLRCVLEGSPLDLAASTATQAEGGMLGTCTINLDLPEQGFRSPTRESSTLAAVRSSRGVLPV